MLAIFCANHMLLGSDWETLFEIIDLPASHKLASRAQRKVEGAEVLPGMEGRKS